MSDTKFTPGPWSPSEQRGTPGHCTVAQVFGPDGKSLAMIEPTVDAAEATANAHLSAAAPELYKALNVSNVFLKMIAEELDLDDDTSITVRVKKSGETVREIASFTLKDTVGKAEEVLAKARGETV